ncbi:hypothetical protein, partial [Enterobacter ludwigii]|uniref:hypothetical protein n=1 Tax=Enterobacter ludwigii TaxID=299767 RepID=UPI0018C56D9D
MTSWLMVTGLPVVLWPATVTVNGKTYAASVLADGTWNAAIPAADVSALPAGTVTVTVAGQSTTGNPVTISHDVTVDLAA